VIARRIALLPDACSRTLPAAAVLGREFPLDALARMNELRENELLDLLDAAIAARVLADVPGAAGQLRFAHVLIRDTLYDGLTPTRRMLLHRQAVDVLASLHGDAPGPHLAELAHHSLAGGELEDGLSYARSAGDRAFALLAYEEAARLYETALEALAAASPDDEAARCGILLALGEARSRAGDSAGAKETFLTAASIAERLGLDRELARAAIGYGGRMLVVRAGGDELLVPLLEKSLGLLPLNEVELRGRLLGRLAGALRDQPSRERRETLSREALELARGTGNDVALAFALDGHAGAIVAPDTVEEYLALGTELCSVGKRMGDRERELQGHSYRMMAKLTLGDMDAVMLEVEAQRRLAQAPVLPYQLWQITCDEALLAAASGRLERAAELVEQAVALGERAIPELAIPAAGFQRYVLCDLRGGVDRVEPEMREIAAAHPARRVFACTLAHIHARQGRLDEAGRELDELAAENFSRVHFDQEWLLAMSLVAETATLLGRDDLAPWLYESILPYRTFNAIDLPEGTRGTLARYLGQLATLLERWDTAEGHYVDAMARNESMGALPWLALTRRDYARMLLARGAPADRDHAKALLAEATAAYRELGITGYG
jgi:tetratricopeptide (TPR) repeat protein